MTDTPKQCRSCGGSCGGGFTDLRGNYGPCRYQSGISIPRDFLLWLASELYRKEPKPPGPPGIPFISHRFDSKTKEVLVKRAESIIRGILYE